MAIGKAVSATRSSYSRDYTIFLENLLTAEIHFRDLAVYHCQARVPPGNKLQFRASLREAFGKILDDDLNLYSRLMHAYRIMQTGV